MRNFGIFAVFLLIFLAAPAVAGVPEEALDRDYQACLGTGAPDAARTAYCACVRNGMRSWSEATYAEVAAQAQATATGQSAQLPGKLQELARQCLAQTLH